MNHRKYSVLLSCAFFYSIIFCQNRKKLVQPKQLQSKQVTQIINRTKKELPIQETEKLKTIMGLKKGEDLTPWNVLSVPKSATKQELLKAYARVIYRYSFDYLFDSRHHLTEEVSAQLTKIVNWAYSELSSVPLKLSEEKLIDILGKQPKAYLFDENKIRQLLGINSRHLNPYEILNVSYEASLEDITHAYVWRVHDYVYEYGSVIDILDLLDINSLLSWSYLELGGNPEQFLTKKSIYDYCNKIVPSLSAPLALRNKELKQLLGLENKEELTPSLILNVTGDISPDEIKIAYSKLLYHFFINPETKLNDSHGVNNQHLKNILLWAYESLSENPERIATYEIIQHANDKNINFSIGASIRKILPTPIQANFKSYEILGLHPQAIYSKEQLVEAYEKNIAKFTGTQIRNRATLQLQKEIIAIFNDAYNNLIGDARVIQDSKIGNLNPSSIQAEAIKKYKLDKKSSRRQKIAKN